ncbi:MAG: dTDP-4-dehydrorhamnose 3,5-epimerase [Nitrococcus sp.]|nr:dTDP-4-dehydrorhamnose 3,5-epimerase [Nitrococcus sp.]
MQFIPTRIPDVILIKPRVAGDERGYFMETWHERKFQEAGLNAHFVQDNHSRSLQGILRGLHYQIRQPQGKLVRVTSGGVFDVAVDLRRGSPSFGRWVGVDLSAENKHMLWIPPGFAHGFYVSADHAEFVYKCTDFWAPQHERTILWDDPELGITWPIATHAAPLLSEKDRAGTALREAELFP